MDQIAGNCFYPASSEAIQPVFVSVESMQAAVARMVLHNFCRYTTHAVEELRDLSLASLPRVTLQTTVDKVLKIRQLQDVLWSNLGIKCCPWFQGIGGSGSVGRPVP